MSRVTLFADVLLPLPLKGTFTYRVPFSMNDSVAVGQRVVVSFGRSKKYTGIIKRLHTDVPGQYEVKYLETLPDMRPFVRESQLRYWEWLSGYYMCSEGEVMYAALPHNAKETSNQDFKPRTESFVRLTEPFSDEEALKGLFDHLEKRASRQLELLVSFIRLSGHFDSKRSAVLQKALTSSVRGGSAALAALIKKGVFVVVVKEQSHFPERVPSHKPITFNDEQQQALHAVNKGFEKHDVVLLHGVTSSGKTELYIQLIHEHLARGEQVLYLLPEIALTTQIIRRLQNHFGNRAAVYHSRFSQMERREVWNNLLFEGMHIDGQHIVYDLILGPRSSLFLPFSKLGLIIVDEEHDPSFKQIDPAPRYHARDAAIYLATMHDAKVLLGSATPSLESYYHAQSGKYALAELNTRHGGAVMPEILIADIRKEAGGKQMKSHLSGLLFRLIKEALDKQEQVILFQNRRGFSLRLQCDLCDWSPGCHQCDVGLVYHKKEQKLKCHYCGYATSLPQQCPLCRSTAIKMRGFGTEKIEDELPILFPGARIARMDLDTTRSKHAYSDLIHDFESQKIDILIGTQMVSKGLDFSNVSLVGIMNADNMLGFPDFRAHERAFQLMAQVSGRSGRSSNPGKVVIQTYNPRHLIIGQVIANDYRSMFVSQITERKKFHYPPFSRLIQVAVMHRDEKLLNESADILAKKLKRAFPHRVLGPEYPLISRIKNQFIKHILVKIDRNHQLHAARKSLLEITVAFQQLSMYKRIRVVINVDPV